MANHESHCPCRECDIIKFKTACRDCDLSRAKYLERKRNFDAAEVLGRDESPEEYLLFSLASRLSDDSLQVERVDTICWLLDWYEVKLAHDFAAEVILIFASVDASFEFARWAFAQLEPSAEDVGKTFLLFAHSNRRSELATWLVETFNLMSEDGHELVRFHYDRSHEELAQWLVYEFWIKSGVPAEDYLHVWTREGSVDFMNYFYNSGYVEIAQAIVSHYDIVFDPAEYPELYRPMKN